MVAVGSPAIKLVFVVAVVFRICTQLIGAAKSIVIIGVYGVSGSSASYFALAAANFDDSGVSRLVHADPVKAGPQHGKSQVGRVNLVGFGVGEAPSPHEKSARGQLNLRDVV